MKNYIWYSELLKPTWAPPPWLFGPVWTVLYIIIFISYAYVGYLFFTHKIPFIVLLPFIVNIIFNGAFTPIQFGLKNLYIASFDIILTLGTLVWAMISVYPYSSWVSLVNIPYFLWVCFATVLQLTITVMNF